MPALCRFKRQINLLKHYRDIALNRIFQAAVSPVLAVNRAFDFRMLDLLLNPNLPPVEIKNFYREVKDYVF